MKIPLVNLGRQHEQLREELDAALRRVLASSAFILGPEVAALEKEFAAFCEVEHAVGVASGTVAIELALEALKLKRGEEVLTTPFTFIGTITALPRLGLRPVFVDIDPETYNLDIRACEKQLTPRTRALLPVHLFGHPVPMEPLQDLARRKGLPIVEDAAQAHGARYKGRRVGSWGELACFSFYPSKNLGAYGDAGIVITSNAALADRLRRFRDQGRSEKYIHREFGANARMDGIQAAILHVKLQHLEDWNRRRRQLAERYRELLASVPVTLPPGGSEELEPVYHLFVIASDRRDELVAFLQSRGIGAGIHYPLPLHRQPALEPWGFKQGEFPNAERAAERVLSLPIFPELTEEELHTVASAVGEFHGCLVAG